MKAETRKKLKREGLEWVIIAAVALLLYLSGYHTEVIGGLQRVFLESRLFQAHTLEQPLSLGTDAVFVSRDGKTLRLSELRGKMVFLNIWATWCPPCIAELPDLNRLTETVNDSTIQYIFLNVDTDHRRTDEFLKRKGYSLPVYYQASALPAELQSSVIPSTFVLDKRGRIVMQRNGMAKYTTRRFIRTLKSFMKETL